MTEQEYAHLASTLEEVHAVLISGLDGKRGLIEEVRDLIEWKEKVSGLTKWLLGTITANVIALSVAICLKLIGH